VYEIAAPFRPFVDGLLRSESDATFHQIAAALDRFATDGTRNDRRNRRDRRRSA